MSGYEQLFSVAEVWTWNFESDPGVIREFKGKPTHISRSDIWAQRVVAFWSRSNIASVETKYEGKAGGGRSLLWTDRSLIQ